MSWSFPIPVTPAAAFEAAVEAATIPEYPGYPISDEAKEQLAAAKTVIQPLATIRGIWPAMPIPSIRRLAAGRTTRLASPSHRWMRLLIPNPSRCTWAILIQRLQRRYNHRLGCSWGSFVALKDLTSSLSRCYRAFRNPSGCTSSRRAMGPMDDHAHTGCWWCIVSCGQRVRDAP